jgi:hypothetical protein
MQILGAVGQPGLAQDTKPVDLLALDDPHVDVDVSP